MAKSNLRYVRGLTVPKTIGTGRKLMHNNVRHTVDMPTGVNGFRAWTDTKVPAGFIRCPCGWSGLPHYAERRACERPRRATSEDKPSEDGPRHERPRRDGEGAGDRADTSGLI